MVSGMPAMPRHEAASFECIGCSTMLTVMFDRQPLFSDGSSGLVGQSAEFPKADSINPIWETGGSEVHSPTRFVGVAEENYIMRTADMTKNWSVLPSND